jgi:hypothetical protein
MKLFFFIAGEYITREKVLSYWFTEHGNGKTKK